MPRVGTILECLPEFVVRQSTTSAKNGTTSLGRHISWIVNAQDKNGDTALNIAARVGNKNLVQTVPRHWS